MQVPIYGGALCGEWIALGGGVRLFALDWTWVGVRAGVDVDVVSGGYVGHLEVGCGGGMRGAE